MLKNNIDSLIAEAMKSKNSVRLNILREIKSELIKASVMDAKTLHNTYKKDKYDEGLESVLLTNMVKRHKTALEEFKSNGASQELIDQYTQELPILQEFAPKEVSEEEIANYTRGIIDKMIVEGVTITMRNMKDVLTEVQMKYPTANGKIVSIILKTYVE